MRRKLRNIYDYINYLVNPDTDIFRKNATIIVNSRDENNGKQKLRIPWKGILAGFILLGFVIVVYLIMLRTF